MKHNIIFILIAVFLMVISATGSEGTAQDKHEAAPKTIWKDIKKNPGPKVSEIPEAYSDLVKNFSDYWNAQKNRDYKKAYDLESSKYRKSTSFDLYNERLKKAAQIIAVRPLEVKPINEKEVVVRASFGYKAGIIDTVRFIQDNWVKEEIGWRHLPEQEQQEKTEEKK
jgi:hypothetical protein